MKTFIYFFCRFYLYFTRFLLETKIVVDLKRSLLNVCKKCIFLAKRNIISSLHFFFIILIKDLFNVFIKQSFSMDIFLMIIITAATNLVSKVNLYRRYYVEMVSCTGTIDSKLIEQSTWNYLENISVRILRSFDD